jgi:hypothetical protein
MVIRCSQGWTSWMRDKGLGWGRVALTIGVICCIFVWRYCMCVRWVSCCGSVRCHSLRACYTVTHTFHTHLSTHLSTNLSTQYSALPILYPELILRGSPQSVSASNSAFILEDTISQASLVEGCRRNGETACFWHRTTTARGHPNLDSRNDNKERVRLWHCRLGLGVVSYCIPSLSG